MSNIRYSVGLATGYNTQVISNKILPWNKNSFTQESNTYKYNHVTQLVSNGNIIDWGKFSEVNKGVSEVHAPKGIADNKVAEVVLTQTGINDSIKACFNYMNGLLLNVKIDDSNLLLKDVQYGIDWGLAPDMNLQYDVKITQLYPTDVAIHQLVEEDVSITQEIRMVIGFSTLED